MEQISIWVTLVFSTDPEVGEDEVVHFLGIANTESDARAVLGRWCREQMRTAGGDPRRGSGEEEGPEPSYWARPGERRALLGTWAAREDAIERYFYDLYPQMRFIIWQKSIFIDKGQVAPWA